MTQMTDQDQVQDGEVPMQRAAHDGQSNIHYSNCFEETTGKNLAHHDNDGATIACRSAN